MSNILKNVQRLVRAATGEEYGDGSTVTDVIVGYAEPGYGNADSVIVLGDWNDKTSYASGERVVTDNLPSRLVAALERIGAEIQWCDEWAQCGSCFRAVRTQPDSYHWKPSYVFLEDDGPTCADCLISDGEDALTGFGNESDSYVNNARKCISWCEPSHVESFGFVKWEPGNEHTYESGWHPGQTDDPTPILAAILERYPDSETVFFLDESSQFYVRFSAYVRGIPA